MVLKSFGYRRNSIAENDISRFPVLSKAVSWDDVRTTAMLETWAPGFALQILESISLEDNNQIIISDVN